MTSKIWDLASELLVDSSKIFQLISRALGYNCVADRHQLTPPSSRENSCGHFPGPEIFLVQVVMKLEPLEISENQTEKLSCKKLDFDDSG